VHPRVAIVPALNEEAAVAESVRALLESGAADQVIVVDDGSTDSTGAEAEQAGAMVIRMNQTSGKGAAVAAGVMKAELVGRPFSASTV
jgi:glycosyltransferase involved in cell wall biosynthesis